MMVIDRFEGNFAVCENDGVMIDIPKCMISDKACDGDVIVFHNGVYVVDTEQTDKRKKRASALFERFKNR